MTAVGVLLSAFLREAMAPALIRTAIAAEVPRPLARLVAHRASGPVAGLSLIEAQNETYPPIWKRSQAVLPHSSKWRMKRAP